MRKYFLLLRKNLPMRHEKNTLKEKEKKNSMLLIALRKPKKLKKKVSSRRK